VTDICQPFSLLIRAAVLRIRKFKDGLVYTRYNVEGQLAVEVVALWDERFHDNLVGRGIRRGFLGIDDVRLDFDTLFGHGNLNPE
jgi:hypothetical protein